MQAVKALLSGNAEDCLRLLDQVKPGKGPAVHIEVEQDIVVTIAPDVCGIAVLRAEALERLGRVADALAVVEQAGGDEKCHVARVVAAELGEHHPPPAGKS
jgi:hypothetical protein